MNRLIHRGFLACMVLLLPVILFSQNTDVKMNNQLKQMEHPNYGVRYDAALGLGRMGSSAEEGLLGLLANEDQNIRGNAALALGMIGSRKSVDLLIKMAESDYPEARMNAIISLARIGDKKAVSSIRKISLDKYANLKLIANAALESMNEINGTVNLSGLLNNRKQQVFEFAVENYLKKDKTSAVRNILNLEDAQLINNKSFLTDILIKTGEPIAESLKQVIDNVNSYSDEAQTVALSALEKIGGEKNKDLFLKLLERGYKKPSFYAALALARLNEEKGRQFLTAALENDGKAAGTENNVDTIIYAAEALASLGDETGIKKLEKLLNEDTYNSSFDKYKMTESLAGIGSENAKAVLWKSAKKYDPSIKQDALNALATFKDKKIIAPLIEMLTKNDFNLYSYEMIGNAFKRLGEYSVEPLLALLEKPTLPENTRVEVVKILSTIDPDKRAFPALRKTILSENPKERDYAMGWAEEVMDKENIPLLISSLQSGSDTDLAVNILSRMGKDASDQLYQALNDNSLNLSKTKILLTLGKMGDRRIVKSGLALLKSDINEDDAYSILGAIASIKPLMINDYTGIIQTAYFHHFENKYIKKYILSAFRLPIVLFTSILVFIVLLILYLVLGGIQSARSKDLQSFIDNREKKLLLYCVVVSLLVWSLIVSYFMVTSLSLYTLIGIMSVLIIYAVIFLLLKLLVDVIAKASLKGRAVKIGEDQLPELYKIVKSVSEKANLKKVPDCYMLQAGGILYIMLIRLVMKDTIIITTKLASLIKLNKTDELKAVLGNEAVEVRRRNFWLYLLILPANILFLLTFAYYRSRKYTNDRINAGLISGKEKVIQSILIFSAGVDFYQKVNPDVYKEQDKNMKGFWYTVFKWFSLKPYFVDRVKTLSR